MTTDTNTDTNIWITNPCRTWQYNTDKPLHVSSARKSAMRWANRRKFGIVVQEVTPHKVLVSTYAPDTKTHNRAVNALARILDAQLDRILYHESCGMIHATIKWNDDGSILEDVLIKQTHDVGDDDDNIFFYGLTWAEVKRHLRDGTPVGDFTIISACLEC
jgi:hypothetical protein